MTFVNFNLEYATGDDFICQLFITPAVTPLIYSGSIITSDSLVYRYYPKITVELIPTTYLIRSVSDRVNNEFYINVPETNSVGILNAADLITSTIPTGSINNPTFATSASYAVSASYSPSNFNGTASYAVFSEVSDFSNSSSLSDYSNTSGLSLSSSYIQAGNIDGIVNSSSFALTSSFALNGGTTLSTGSTYPITSSWSNNSISSSYSNTAQSSVSSSYSLSSSYSNTTQNSTSASYLSGANAVLNNLTVTGQLNATQISGSQIYITSSQLIVTDNILVLNANIPHVQYSGITTYDSGSSGNQASILWDGLNDFYFVSSSGGGYNKKFILGPNNQGTLTSGIIPIADVNNSLSDSIITQSGNNINISGNLTTQIITSSGLYGTASWSTNSITASYVLDIDGYTTITDFTNYTASNNSKVQGLLNATSSYIKNNQTASMSVLSASYSLSSTTASYSLSSTTASYSLSSSTASYSLSSSTASYSLSSSTASYSLSSTTASYFTAPQLIYGSVANPSGSILPANTSSAAWYYQDTTGSLSIYLWSISNKVWVPVIT